MFSFQSFVLRGQLINDQSYQHRFNRAPRLRGGGFNSQNRIKIPFFVQLLCGNNGLTHERTHVHTDATNVYIRCIICHMSIEKKIHEQQSCTMPIISVMNQEMADQTNPYQILMLFHRYIFLIYMICVICTSWRYNNYCLTRTLYKKQSSQNY